METIQERLVTSFKKTSLILSLIVILIGVLAEIGWQFDIDLLKSFIPESTFMNPLSAVNFILIGLSIQIVGRIKMNKYIWFAEFAGLFVVLVGLLRLETIIFGFNTQIDQFLFNAKISENRIAPNSVLVFIFLGTALFFLAKGKYYKLIHILCFSSAFIALLTLLGYTYSVESLYSFFGLTPMALSTSIAFIMSSLSISFAQPDKGFMKIFCTDSLGGEISRYLVPSVIVIPSFIGRVTHLFQDLGLINTEFGFIIFNILLTGIFLLLIVWISIKLNMIDFERKKGELRLKFSELRYRRLFESAKDGILILDFESGKIIEVNPFLQKLLGYSKEELLGRQLWQIRALKDVVSSKAAFITLQNKGYTRYENLPLQTKTGLIVETEFISNTYVVGENKVIQCNIRDITERKAAQEKILMQATALEAAANSVMITDTKGIIQWVNSAFTKLTGYPFKEAVGKSTRILNSGKQNKAFYKNLWDTILSGNVWKGEIIDKKKDGSLCLEEQTITPVKNENGKIISYIAIKHDITEQKKLENELKARNKTLEMLSESQEEGKKAMLNVMEDLELARGALEMEKVKDEAMLKSIGEGLIAVNNDKNITMVNYAAEKMLGWTSKYLIGRKLTNIRLEDENGNYIPPDMRPTHEAISSGVTVENTFFLVNKDKKRFPIAINVTPIKLNNKTIGAIVMFRDITREREIDRAKSEFVSVASHQLRTPLGITKWYLEVLLGDLYLKKAPKFVKDSFDVVFNNNERVLALVRDLLLVSRIDQGKVKNDPKSTNIIKAITDVVKELQMLAVKKNIKLNFDIQQSKIPNMNIDPLQLHEVIENLIANGIEYTPPLGRVDIIVKKNGGEIIVTVKDTGIGISDTDQKNIFTKFFRTQKAIGKNPEGSGLGLYVVKSYIESWGGKISFESSEGKGSTFTITLPIVIKKSI